jgi:prepilin-type N-terminal cleavage/methylation domain-containing protein
MARKRRVERLRMVTARAGRRPMPSREPSGVSLLEVVVCSAIVGIAAVGVALMFGAGQAYIQAEGDNRVALFLAQQKVEQLRALGPTELETNRVTDATDTEPPATATPECLDTDLNVSAGPTCAAGYRRTWSVVCVDRDDYSIRRDCGAGPSRAIRIRVAVETTPPDAKARAITLESLVAPR